MSGTHTGGGFGVLTSSRKPEPSKVEPDARRSARVNLEEVSFVAIIRVDLRDYVPGCVILRKQISPWTFTAQVDPPALHLLQEDPRVVSISPSKPLVQIG